MSGEHFSGGQMPHHPVERLDDALYTGVERNIVYACTDVALRDPETNRIFLGSRQTEPQIGPWLIGGRNMYGKGLNENAAMQVRNDVGLHIDEGRFSHAATYSTGFPVASPDRQEHGRHTVNAVMMVELKPEEVAELNRKCEDDELREEYKGGRWYDLEEIADSDSDFAYVIKQLVRDIHAHDILKEALHEEALHENEIRDLIAAEQEKETARQERIAALSLLFDLPVDEAKELERVANNNAGYAVVWANIGRQRFEGKDTSLQLTLQGLLGNEEYGDVEIAKQLKQLNIDPPSVLSENGPGLREVLAGAVLALEYNARNEGRLFSKATAVQSLFEPGISKEA